MQRLLDTGGYGSDDDFKNTPPTGDGVLGGADAYAGGNEAFRIEDDALPAADYAAAPAADYNSYSAGPAAYGANGAAPAAATYAAPASANYGGCPSIFLSKSLPFVLLMLVPAASSKIKISGVS